jgi:uncharacterized protein DUF5063
MEENTAELITQFRKVAGHFCDLVENCTSCSRAMFIKLAHGFLADLYRMGPLLPSVEPVSDDATQDRVSDEQCWKVYEAISEKLKDRAVYWMVWDPADPADNQAIQQTLADDLADIYRDLRSALLAEESETVTNDALWSLRFQYQHHWGQHAVSALTAMHSLLYGPSYLGED